LHATHTNPLGMVIHEMQSRAKVDEVDDDLMDID
jgi:hypothetical protein